MSVDLIVPTLGESITEATVSKWLKKIGESFEVDEPLVEIETDKITVEVPAPSAGVLSEIKVKEGNDVNIGGVLGIIGESDETIPPKEKKQSQTKVVKEDTTKTKPDLNNQSNLKKDSKLSPSVKKILEENNLDSSKVNSSREDGRLTKADVMEHLNNPSTNNKKSTADREEIVPMSKIRRTIATRLKEAQNTAAILTTFNEVDMSEIIKVREAKKEDFMKRYDVKLGFMSFFVKACVMALQEFPAVNAEIRDENIVYKKFRKYFIIIIFSIYFYIIWISMFFYNFN